METQVFPFNAPVAEVRHVNEVQKVVHTNGARRKNNRKNTRGRHTQYVFKTEYIYHRLNYKKSKSHVKTIFHL
jgi:hypothetical protein